MHFFEGIRLALVQVWTHKLKSFFSLVGVVIGISFLIMVITIVEGMNHYVREDFAGSLFGVNTFTVLRRQQVTTGRQDDERRRRMARNPDLTTHDVEVVREAVPDARYFAYSAQRGIPEARSDHGSRRNVLVIGGSPEYQAIQGWEVEEGRGLTPLEDRQALPVAVIGSQIAERLFPTTSPIDRRIRVGGYRFRVVGVLVRQGGILGNLRDASILIPFETYQRTMARRRDEVGQIQVKTTEASEMAPMMAAVEGALRRDRGQRPGEENSFWLQTSSDLLSAWESINRILFVALPALVGISLVVGGIVIMNIMLLSVTDRTREIGLRKSLGAMRKDILFQFLTEASTLSILGSAIGIGIGLGLAQVVAQISPLPATVSLPWLGVALGLGLGVGILSGFYPAFRASKLDPIEALRFE